MPRWTAFSGCLLCFSIPASAAQEALRPETLLLERVKSRMADNLRRLPAYTCSQTIEQPGIAGETAAVGDGAFALDCGIQDTGKTPVSTVFLPHWNFLGPAV